MEQLEGPTFKPSVSTGTSFGSKTLPSLHQSRTALDDDDESADLKLSDLIINQDIV